MPGGYADYTGTCRAMPGRGRAVVAATDYVSAPFKVLGTDGFGCSDTVAKARRVMDGTDNRHA